MRRSIRFLIIIAILVILLITACAKPGGQTPTSAAPGGSTGILDGKTLLETRCASCHSLAKIYSRTGDAAQWQRIVDNMIAQGAKLTTDEEKVLVEYLAANLK